METFFVTKVSIPFFCHRSQIKSKQLFVWNTLIIDWNRAATNIRALYKVVNIKIKRTKKIISGKRFHTCNFAVNHCCNMKTKRVLKKIFQYFLQGLIILAPIALTIYAVTVLFNFVDGILPSLIQKIFPHWIGTGPEGESRFPGLGFVLVILIVIMVGYISSSYIISRLVDLFDKILERTPGIKLIYSTIKDFFEAFAGNKRKFDKAVLVSIESPEVWQIGFITQQELQEFGLQEHVAVYVPQSFALTGRLYFVKRDRVKLLTDISSTDAMKFAISGGVTHIEDEHEHDIKK